MRDGAPWTRAGLLASILVGLAGLAVTVAAPHQRAVGWGLMALAAAGLALYVVHEVGRRARVARVPSTAPSFSSASNLPNAAGANVNYMIDWSRWLRTGDVLESSVWIVPLGLVYETDTFDESSATVWLSGGVSGTRYRVVNRVGTTAGRIDERSIWITVSGR